MATRFYGRESGSAPVSVAVDAAWEESGAPFASKPMFTTSDGADTLTTVNSFAQGESATERTHRQLISEPMVSGLVFDASVTYKCQVQVLESAADDNINTGTGLRIVSEDGSTVRHTVKAVGNYAAGEWGGSLRNQAFLDGDAGAGSYTTVTGDRLVLEVGGRVTAGTTPSGSSRWGSAGTGDLPEDNTSTATDLRPWFECSLNITFAGGATITGTANLTLPMITLSATGRTSIHGAMALVLPMITLLATGTVPILAFLRRKHRRSRWRRG